MVGKTKTPTKAQRQRIEEVKSMGCIACWMGSGALVAAEYHHIVSGYRMGHDYGIPLCPWHHRGQPLSVDQRPSECRELMGPSLALQKRAFVEEYGTELELLSEVNQLLGVSDDHSGD